MSTGWPSSLASALNETDNWEDAFDRWCRDEDASERDFYEWTVYPSDWEREFVKQCGEDNDDAFCWSEYRPHPLSCEISLHRKFCLEFDEELFLNNEDVESPVFQRRDWFLPSGTEETYKIQDLDDATSAMITIIPATSHTKDTHSSTQITSDHSHQESETSSDSTVSIHQMLTEKNLIQHDDQMPSQDSRDAIGSIFDIITQLEALNEQMVAKLASANDKTRKDQR